MKCNRSLSILFVLAMASPAWAQRGHVQSRGVQGGGGMHGGGGAVHPNQGQHQGMVAPHQQMEYEFWQHQMWLNEMMSAPRQRGRTQAPARSMQRQAPQGDNAQPNTSQQPNESGRANTGMTGGSRFGQSNQDGQGAKSPMPGLSQQPSHHANGANSPREATPASGLTDQPPHHSSGTKAEHESAPRQERHHEKDREIRKLHGRESGFAYQASPVNETLTAALLKNVHTRLQKADTDYAGHRVLAMNHIGDAIRQLGGIAAVTTGYEYGGGNLPQAESDRILDYAIFQLNKIEGSLGTGSHVATHHGLARRSVAQAVHELEVARRIR